MIRLERRDAGRNVARFYKVDVQPALFGWSAVFEWGRIGSGGQVQLRLFETQEEASAAVAAKESTKRRRGYMTLCTSAQMNKCACAKDRNCTKPADPALCVHVCNCADVHK